MEDEIRALLANSTFISTPIVQLSNEDDLYTAGLTSFGSVQLMLALEEAFDVEFPERLLNRRSFASISAIAASVHELVSAKA